MSYYSKHLQQQCCAIYLLQVKVKQHTKELLQHGKTEYHKHIGDDFLILFLELDSRRQQRKKQDLKVSIFKITGTKLDSWREAEVSSPEAGQRGGGEGRGDSVTTAHRPVGQQSHAGSDTRLFPMWAWVTSPVCK